MKRAIAFLGVFFICLTAAQATANEALEYVANAGLICAVKPLPSEFVPGITAFKGSDTGDRQPAVPPADKGGHRIRLESNDDLPSVSFTGGAISPYVGASIDLLPLPNYDPETTSSQVLAYGLGAGFGCELGSDTRLSLRYQIRFLSETDSSLSRISEDEEIHRISLGLQTSF